MTVLSSSLSATSTLLTQSPLSSSSSLSQHQQQQQQAESRQPLREVKEPVFDTRNTSTKSPEALVGEVLRVLGDHEIVFKRKNFKFLIEGNQEKVEGLVNERRSGLDIEREIIERYEDGGEAVSTSSPPRLIEQYLAVDDDGNASDSSDGGARDSLDDTPEEEEELRRALASTVAATVSASVSASVSESSSSSSSSTSTPALSRTSVAVVTEKLVRFELEICRLGPGLHGLRMKRLEGDHWLYKEFCDNFLSAMRL